MNKRFLPEVAISFTWDPRYSVCCATTSSPIFRLYQKCCDLLKHSEMNKRFLPEVAIDFPHPSFRKLLLIFHTLPSFWSHVLTLKPSEMNQRFLPEVAIGFTWDPRYSVCCATISPIFCVYQKCCDLLKHNEMNKRFLPEVAINFPHPSGILIARGNAQTQWNESTISSGSYYWFYLRS